MTRPGARPYALGGVYRDYFNPLTGLCPQVHRSAGLDRAKGGDYAELGTAARAVFRTIRQVGVRPTLVASGWQTERSAGATADPGIVDLTSDAVDDKLTARQLRRQAHFDSVESALIKEEPEGAGDKATGEQRKASGNSPSWNSNKTVLPLFAEAVVCEVAAQEGVEIVRADGEALPLVVWHAAKLGGYAVTNDCDVLCFSGGGPSGSDPAAHLRVIFVEDLRITTGGNAGVGWRSVQPATVADALGLTLAQMPMLGTLVGNDSTQHTTVGTRLLLSPLHEHAIWSVCTNSAPLSKSLMRLIAGDSGCAGTARTAGRGSRCSAQRRPSPTRPTRPPTALASASARLCSPAPNPRSPTCFRRALAAKWFV